MDREETKRAGIYLYNQNNYDGALEQLITCGIDPYQDSELALYLGLTYSRLNNSDKAIELLDFVNNNDQNFLHKLQSKLALSYLYATLKRYDESDELLADLDRGGLEKASIYALWGYVAEQKNEHDAAIRRYKMAINLEPENTNALNSLGYLYASLNTNLDEALTYCRRAVSLEPQNASYLDSLGLVCFNLNKTAESLDFFERAYAINPQNEMIAEHLEQARRAMESN